jgi:YHS domain-containing protein
VIAHAILNGTSYWFGSDRCRERFEANPAKFTLPDAKPEGMDAPV